MNILNNTNNCQTNFKGFSNIYYIERDDVKDRLKDLNRDTPNIYTTSFIKQPQEITLRTVARNNIMLDMILSNQEAIINNQKELDEKIDKITKSLDISV